MSLYGFNITPQDIWANRSREGQFKIDGMTADEWVNAKKGTYDEFWHVHRSQQLQENFNKIWTNSSNPSQFPLDGIFRMLGSTTDKSVLQTLNSMPEWEHFANIKTNGGQAVGFDLETFGDILNPNANPSEFGITEFAIGRRIYGGTDNVDRAGRSYIFGIDDSQKNYLTSLNKKFESQGWNALEKSEQVALGRMSMYAQNNAIKKEYINNKLIYVAGELGPEIRTIDAINAGISNLYQVHTNYLREGTNEKDIFIGLVNKLIEANNEDNTVLYGANSQYDITSIKNIAKRFGIDVSNIDNIKNNILDVIYSARSLAASNEQSINEYFRIMNGVKAGASMDEQLEVYRFPSNQKHQAYQDTMTEGDILDIRVDEITSVKDKLQNIQDNYKQYQGLEDSIFLVRNGKLNQERAQEMAIVDGKPVANYSFTNEYWTIDTKRSQYIDIDGEQKYSLVLNNYVDGENTSVVWIRDSQEDAIEELTRKSSVFNTKQITESDAKWQQAFKYKDFGRREFDKLISPSNVGLDNGHDIYGFATLEKYLKLIDELPEVDVKDVNSIKGLMKYIEENYENDKLFKSYYQVQAYAGMYDKLKNEKKLLNNIVEQINNNYDNASNVDKTIVLREAYTKSIEYLDSIYERKGKSNGNNIISDALGIDIAMPDDSIKRINGYNTDTIAYDVNRIFGKLSNNDILDILEDMSDRGLLQDKEKYANISKRVAHMSKDDLYGISQDLAYELSKVTQDLVNKNSSIVNAFDKGSKIKNKQFLGQKIEDSRLIKYKKKSFDKAYSESTDAINGIISDAINNRPDTVYIGTTGDDTVFKNYINKIASELNLEPISDKKGISTSGDLLYELFTKTKDYKGNKTKYAINNYIDKGLSTFITTGENGNAYLFLTKQEDAAKFYSNLIDGKFDLSNKQNLINPKSNSGYLPIHDYASFVELPKINKYQLSDSVLKTVNQGKQEKILIPQLNVIKDNGQPIRAYYNSGEYGFYSTLRMSMGGAIEHVLYGEYKEGSTSVRKAQNKYLEDLSTSASYRGRVIKDAEGNVIKVERIAEFTPSDYIQANEAKIENELYDLFKSTVQIEPEKDLNTAQKIVMEFGKHTNIDKEQYISSIGQMGYMNKIMNDSEFKEFFVKRLFIGNVSDDNIYMSGLKGSELDRNIFTIIKDIASKETKIFDKSVVTALSNIPTDTLINQVLSETAQKKGIVSFGVRPGDYNDAASLHSTMRPTYNQQNNALYFSLEDANNKLFTGFENNPVRFNTAVIAAKEYNDKMALAKTYQPIPGKDYATRRRSIVSKIKQIGDYDLQLKYQDMLANADEYAKELNINKKRYTDTLDFFQKNFMSLHEGKVFMAPGLSEQALFQERDAKKMIYNLDGLDINKSKKIMEKLVRDKTIVTNTTIIGIRENGAPVFFDGPDSVFTKENISDFFDDIDLDTTKRKSYIVPVIGDIADTKIMIDGAEKGTVHAINMTSFMDYTGIKNYDTALRIANSMFNKIFDGAAIAANFGFEKHGNTPSIHSIWNTITSNYIESGYGEALVGHLNKMRLEQDAFKGINEFKYINGEIISSSTDAYNFSSAVELLYNQVKNNEILQTDVNNRIMQEIDIMNKTNTYNAILQRQNMNEHMGTRMVIDQRIEQAIRTRGMQLDGNGMEQIDNDWADIIKEYSKRYDASGNNVEGPLQEFLNVYGRNKNASRIHLLNAKSDTQRSAKGIVESLMYYYNPEKYNPENKNIVKININDLMDKGIQIKGGLSTKELQNSIFFVDGKPSEFLQEQAKKSNVDLYNKSYSIFIDLNGTTFDISQTVNGKTDTHTFKGVMIPIQSVFDDIDDKVYFQSQQSTVTSFMNKLTRIMSNPKEYKNVSEELKKSYSTFIESLFEQIGYLEKDSDVYKAFQQYIMPTSQELLAQDETAPLIEELLKDDFKSLIDKRKKYEKLVEANPTDIKLINELGEIYKSIDDKLSDISNRIINDENYYSKLMTLGNEQLRKASEIIIDNKTQYGLAVAISKEAFERQGIDIGVVGLEAFSDWETKNFDYGLDNIREFSKDKGFGRRKITIAKKLNELGIDGLEIDSKQSITEQLNTYFVNKYGLDEFSLSIKDLNKAIADGEGKKILSVFENIGEMYLTEVGTFGELTRYPSFRSQPIVKVMLDTTLQGKQIRGSSAVLSSLTNVDFDGDKMFLAILTNGMSVINQGTKINGKNVLDISKKIFKRFAERESRGLLAELIREGDIFKSDNPNATTRQYAAMLKKLKPDEYEKVFNKWVKENGINITSLNESQQKAIEYAANNSKQMHDAFIKMGFNTITDIESMLSSIASRFRKINIGAISTPNYHMRNALLIALNDPNISAEQKLLLNDTYVSLSNMLSKAGGFFSEAEQKSIDVKHAKDGLEIARTTRYSTGMSILFGNRKHDPKSNIYGIQNILEATNAGLFKKSDEELKIMANLIANTSNDVFNKSVQKLYKGEKEIQEYIYTLRKLLDAQREIPNFDKIYADSLIKGSLDDNIYNVIQKIENLNNGKFSDLETLYKGTGFYNVLDIFANSFSAEKSKFVKNNIYFELGNINGEWKDKAYIYDGNNKFKEINIETGAVDKKSVTIHPSKLTDVGEINIRDYINSSKTRTKVSDTVTRKKFENTLNNVLFGKKGTLLSSMPDNFIKLGNKNGGINKYGSAWSAVNALFSSNIQNKNTSDIYKNIKELANTYDYAVSKNFIDTSKRPSSSEELIRQINKSIAENPRDKTTGSFIFNNDYDTILRNKMSEVFGSEEILNRFIKESKTMSSFDSIKQQKYKDSLLFLNENTYDIIEQQRIIDGSVSGIQVEFDALRKQGASDIELKPLQDVLTKSNITSNDLLKTLRKENASTIKVVQQDVYQLFDTTNQMDTFFSWNKHNQESIVGFGNYLGIKFKQLSKSDVQSIIEAGELAKKSLSSMSVKEQYALTHTLDALRQYNPTATTSGLIANKTSKEVNDYIVKNKNIINDVYEKISKRTTEQTEEASKRAASNTVKKKTLLGTSIDGIKDTFNKIPKKSLGIVAGSLAALGVANNLLHNNKHKSPVSPEFSNDHNNPGFKNNSVAGSQVAPPSKRTIYVDKPSGLQFKVSAKTNNYISDVNNAKLIGLSNGGQANIYSQQDTSGVTDSWLANKFAELTN